MQNARQSINLKNSNSANDIKAMSDAVKDKITNQKN